MKAQNTSLETEVRIEREVDALPTVYVARTPWFTVRGRTIPEIERTATAKLETIELVPKFIIVT